MLRGVNMRRLATSFRNPISLALRGTGNFSSFEQNLSEHLGQVLSNTKPARSPASYARRGKGGGGGRLGKGGKGGKGMMPRAAQSADNVELKVFSTRLRRGETAEDVLATLSELQRSPQQQNVLHYAAAFHRLRELRQWRKALGVFLALRSDGQALAAADASAVGLAAATQRIPEFPLADAPMDETEAAFAAAAAATEAGGFFEEEAAAPPVARNTATQVVLSIEQQRLRQLHNEALVMCGKTGQWRLAFRLLNDMHEEAAATKASPTLPPFSSLRQQQQQLQLQQPQSPKSWMAPDHGNFTAVLTACARAKDVDPSNPRSSKKKGPHNGGAPPQAPLGGLPFALDLTASTPWEAALALLAALRSKQLTAAAPPAGGSSAPQCIGFGDGGGGGGASGETMAVHPYSYNAAVACCARYQQWGLVRGLLRTMQSEGHALTAATLEATLHPESGISLTQALAGVADLDKSSGGGVDSSAVVVEGSGRRLHHLPASLPSPYLRNKLLSLCRRDKDCAASLLLLATPVTSGDDKAANSFSSSATRVQQELSPHHLSSAAGDVIGATIVLHTLAENGRWADALQILDGVFRGAAPQAAASLVAAAAEAVARGEGGGLAEREEGGEEGADSLAAAATLAAATAVERNAASVVVVDELLLVSASFLCARLHGRKAFFCSKHCEDERQRISGVTTEEEGEVEREEEVGKKSGHEEAEEAEKAVVSFLRDLRPGGRFPVPPPTTASAVAASLNAVLSLGAVSDSSSKQPSSPSAASSVLAQRLSSVRAGRKFLAACHTADDQDDEGAFSLSQAMDARPYLALVRACDPSSALPTPPHASTFRGEMNNRSSSHGAGAGAGAAAAEAGPATKPPPAAELLEAFYAKNQDEGALTSELQGLLATECVGILQDLDAFVLSRGVQQQQQQQQQQSRRVGGGVDDEDGALVFDSSGGDEDYDEDGDGFSLSDFEPLDDFDDSQDLDLSSSASPSSSSLLSSLPPFPLHASPSPSTALATPSPPVSAPSSFRGAFSPAAAHHHLTPAALAAAASEAFELAAKALSANGAWADVRSLFANALEAEQRKTPPWKQNSSRGAAATTNAASSTSSSPSGRRNDTGSMLSRSLVEASLAAAANTAFHGSSEDVGRGTTHGTDENANKGLEVETDDDEKVAAGVAASASVVAQCRANGAAVGPIELNAALRLLLKDGKPYLAFAVADALSVATDDVDARGTGSDSGGVSGGDVGGGDVGGGDFQSEEGGASSDLSSSHTLFPTFPSPFKGPLVAPSLVTFHLAMSAALSAKQGGLALGVLQDMRRRAAGGGRDGLTGLLLAPNDVTHQLAQRALASLRKEDAAAGRQGEGEGHSFGARYLK